MLLAAGAKLGSYEIVAPLGAGGMGEVYRARDAILKREVAIKILPASYSFDPERLRRFQQEAEAAAALNHPNILVVYHVGQQDGTSYIVTELLQGSTLREKLQGGSLPVHTAINYVVQIAHGLAAAHSQGIVHRDLKPENLFVTKDGRIKILDFGLAKLVRPISPTTEHTVSDNTHPGVVMGTVGYMSPEQVRGQAADARSDIFAFGAMLFEMLTGSRAFRGTTPADTMSAILKEEPSVSQLTKEPNPGLQRIVRRCLEKNPEQRFQSSSDLAFAIEALSDLSSGSQPANLVRASRLPRWVVAAAVLVVVAAGVGIYLRRASWITGPAAPSGPLDIRPLTETGKAFRVAATFDGRYVVYVNGEAGKYELRLLQVATERDVQVLPASSGFISSLHFSPDGNFIYFLRTLNPADPYAATLFRIATLGGPATPLATDARLYSVTVSPDGKQIAYISQAPDESQIVTVDPDGGNRHVLVRRPSPYGFSSIEWSPFPDRLAAVIFGKEDMGLLSVELPTGKMRDLSVTGWGGGGGGLGQPAWSSDGVTIFVPAFSRQNGVTQIWAFDAGTGGHRAITSGSTEYSLGTLSATATGELIGATSTPALTLWATDQSGQLRPFPASTNEGYESVIWAEGRIVTSNQDEMMVHDADGHNSTKLRSYSSIYRDLARCGTDKVVYWAADTQHQSHIARTDVITGSTSRLTDGPLDDAPACTPDGSTLIFVHCLEQRNRCLLTRRSTDPGPSATLYEFSSDGMERIKVSPDGTRILLQKVDPGDPYGWAIMIPVAGGNPQKLRMPVPAAEIAAYGWSPDSKSILYARSENGVGNLWSVPIGGGVPRKLTAFDSDRISSFDVSPDNRLVISRGHWLHDAVLIKNAK